MLCRFQLLHHGVWDVQVSTPQVEYLGAVIEVQGDPTCLPAVPNCEVEDFMEQFVTFCLVYHAVRKQIARDSKAFQFWYIP